MGELGDNLRYIREEVRGMTRAELDVASKVSTGLIQKIEQGRVNPTIDKLLKLAGALNVTVDQLVGMADPPPLPKVAKTTRGRFTERKRKRTPARRVSGKGSFREPAFDQPLRAAAGF